VLRRRAATARRSSSIAMPCPSATSSRWEEAGDRRQGRREEGGWRRREHEKECARDALGHEYR
jgi:hypothetical protein